jgi:L-arabinokinase
LKAVCYYITAHGYGHGTRSCDIINALHRAAPDLHIIVKTDLPADFMDSRLPDTIDVRCGAFDVGLIQHDAIQVDLEASLATIEKLYAREDALIEQEAAFMQDEQIGVVVADIPAIPLAAARQTGIPNIATGNFGWDWIYEEFVPQNKRWQFFADKFRSVYAKTDLLLRQPFAEAMAPFPVRIDLPLLADPGTARRARIAETTGADPDKKWILLSFISLTLQHGAPDRLCRLKDCELFTVEPLEWPGTCIRKISRSAVSFSDTLASMDVVVTKPGFGIISECIANNKPIIYSERKQFREYDVLVQSIRRYCRNAFIPNAELYAGDLTRALHAIERTPAPPEQIPAGGADLAASEILKRMS